MRLQKAFTFCFVLCFHFLHCIFCLLHQTLPQFTSPNCSGSNVVHILVYAILYEVQWGIDLFGSEYMDDKNTQQKVKRVGRVTWSFCS